MKRVFMMMLAAMTTLTMAGCSQKPKEPTADMSEVERAIAELL